MDVDPEDDGCSQRAKAACVNFWSRFYNLIKAIFVRLLLSTTLFIITCRGAAVNGSQLPETTEDWSTGISRGRYNSTDLQEPWFFYWMPTLGIVLFIPEFLVTWCFNHGNEYKWWSPTFAVYITCGLMAVWIVELDLYALKWNGVNTYSNASSFEEMTDIFPKENFASIQGFDFGGIKLRPYEWARIVTQLFFVMLVIAKWLSPKGAVTSEQLSQLLLVYIAMATDILDLMESLMYIGIGDHITYFILFMLAYSIAHLQFTLNFTAKRARPGAIRSRYTDDEEESSRKRILNRVCCCLYTDMWALLVTVCLQDGPFFALRMYCIFVLQIITFGNVFFTVKNGIVLLMDFYRIVGIIVDECHHHRQSGEADSEEIVRRTAIPRQKGGQPEADDTRASVSLTLTAESMVKAVAEFLFTNGYGIDNDEVDAKRKNWRQLKSETTRVFTDDDIHLVYEVDILCDDTSQSDGTLLSNYDDIENASPVLVNDVRLRNVVIEQSLSKENTALSRIQHSAAVRQKINQVVPMPERRREPPSRAWKALNAKKKAKPPKKPDTPPPPPPKKPTPTSKFEPPKDPWMLELDRI